MDPLQPQFDPVKESQHLTSKLLTLITSVFPDLQDHAGKIVSHIIQEYDIPTLQALSVSPSLFVKIVGETLIRLQSRSPEVSQASPEAKQEQETADSRAHELEEPEDNKQKQPTDDQSTVGVEDVGETRDRVPLFERGITDADKDLFPSPKKWPSPTSSLPPIPPGIQLSSTAAGILPSFTPAVQAGPAQGLSQAGPPPGLAQVFSGFPIRYQLPPVQHQRRGQPTVQPAPHQYIVPVYPSGQYPGQPGQYPGQPRIYSGQYSGQPGQYSGQYPGQPGQYTGQPGQYSGQPGQYSGQPGRFPVLPGQPPEFSQQPGLPRQPQFNPFAAQFGLIPPSPGFVPHPNLQQQPQLAKEPQETFQQQVAQTLFPGPLQRRVPSSPSLTDTDGQTTPSDISTESDNTVDQFKSCPDLVDSSCREPTASVPAAPLSSAQSSPGNLKQSIPVPKVASSAPGLRVTSFGLPTGPPGLRTPWKHAPAPADTGGGDIHSGPSFGSGTLPSNPVGDTPSTVENTTSPGPVPNVPLSALGLPVLLSGLPTAPPGLKVPWKRVRANTDIVADPATQLSPQPDSTIRDHRSSLSLGLPVSSPTLPIQPAGGLQETSKPAPLSWSHIVRGSLTDIPNDLTKREQVSDQTIIKDDYLTDQIDFFWSDNLCTDFSDAESTESTTMSKRRRNPSSESGQAIADVMKAFSTNLSDLEAEVQLNIVGILAMFHPKACQVGHIWHEYREIHKTRPKRDDFQNIGKSIDDIFQRFDRVIGKGRKTCYSLTAIGVEYAKELGLLPAEVVSVMSQANTSVAIVADAGHSVVSLLSDEASTACVGGEHSAGGDSDYHKVTAHQDVPAVPEYEGHLLDSDMVEIQRHAVISLSLSYPKPLEDNELNRAIKKSRGKGVASVKEHIKHFADVIACTKDPHDLKMKNLLTDKGVQYAKLLRCKIQDKTAGVATVPAVSEYEAHLWNPELVEIQRHAVIALASVYPRSKPSDQLNKAIKTSRGRGAVVEELGLRSLEDCMKECSDLVIAFVKDPKGSKKVCFVLTHKGIEYAKLLGCKIPDKPAVARPIPLRSQTFTRREPQGTQNAAAGGGAQLFMDDDDEFPELGAVLPKKDPPKSDLEFLNDSFLTSEERPPGRAAQAQGGDFRPRYDTLGVSPVAPHNQVGPMSHYSSVPVTYSQLKEKQKRSASPASTTSQTAQSVKKTDFKSDFTYNPEEVATGSMGGSLMNTRHLTKENLEAIAVDCIDRLSNADVLVTPKAVECRMLDLTRRSNWRELGVPGVHRVEMLECVRQLQRMQGKVSSYVQTFVSVRSIATLHDLTQCMKEFITNNGTFDNLKLGPISAQPTIREYFNLPPGSPVLEISSPEVIEHLRDYVNKNNLWTTPVDLKNFLEYLQEEYGTDTPYELGVRMKSLPLAMQMLKKAQRDQGRTVRECITHMKDLTENEVKSGFSNFKSKFLLENSDGDGFVIRKFYLELGPAEVMADVFGKFNVLLQFMLQYGASVKGHTLQRLHQVTQEFVKQVKRDSLGHHLFQLSVCVSAHEVQESLQTFMEKMFPAPKGGHRDDDDDESGSQISVNPPPKLDDLLSKFRYNLERCIGVSGTLTLEYLAAIEKKLCEHFNHQFFNTMGQGSFLAFLLHQPHAKKIFEELGGNNLTAGGATSDGKNSLYRPSQGDLVDLVHQCDIKDESMEATCHLEAAVCSHYKVSQVQGAGHGPVSRIQGVVKRQKHGHSRDHNVVYESAICLGSRYSEQSVPSAEKHAGILGSQTEEAALLHLEACPLLENLETWSQWSLVFQPQFGPLKTFVQKHGGIKTHRTSSGLTYSTTIQALETEPGVLLKITAQTSIDLFCQNAMAGDVSSSCGHLVSLVVANKGVKSMSMELLANHMQSALFTMNSEGATVNGDGGYNRTSIPKVVHFVRECLCHLPIRMCEAVANQIFLEPVSHVLGGTTSKKLILESCPSLDQTSRIYLLGMLLGIDTWSQCYQDHLNRAHQSIIPARTERKKKESFSDLLDDGTPVESEDEEPESDLDEDEAADPWSDSDSVHFLSDLEPEPEMKEVTEEEVTTQDEAVTMDTMETTSGEVDIVTEEKGGDEETTPVGEEREEVAPEDANLTLKERECKKVVDQIRKEEFGIGIMLNEDAEKLMKVQQERLGRSLDRLSRDLYSKDTHFVLELVQNADDNTYPPSDPARSKRSSGPAIRFIVETDCVTVLNNECGFEEKNIRALCDVGRSTKGKHKFGYIGQKGIGFKSVFRVTDKPEVHSSGYHISFNVESGPMGYILPHWIEDHTPETTNRWTTKIILKLKEELDMSKGHQQTRTLANRFHDVKPSLLLFLHRLRSIVIENKVDDVTSKMARRDIGENIIEIKHNTGTDKWLVTKKLLDASKISPKGKSGTDIESTEIALAFPLQGKDKGSYKYRPSQQPVFAFLPLRSYGFKFIVQGDFEVPSSREDVDSDSSWNQGLLDAIPQLFIESLDTFKMQPDLNALDAVNAYLQFVPMENETLDFFKSVASNIHQMLKSKPCLPTEPDEDGNVEWKLPSQMVICQDPLIQQVISAEMLEQHLGLFYLHNAVMSAGNTPLLQSLGIKQISTQHLLEIGKSLAKQWLEDDVDVRIPSIAKWLVCIYRSLNEYSTNVEELKVLKNLAVIPLSKGQLVTLDASTVFFPLQKEKAKTNMTDPLWHIEQDLNTLDPCLLTCLDHIPNSQIEKILEQCDVRQLNAQDVIQHHIMPAFKSEECKHKSRELLCAYVVYIKHHVMRDRSILSMEELRSVIQVDTNQGMKNPATEPVHFTPAYQNRIDLQNMLPGCKWVLLSAAYMPADPTHQDISQWRDFFIKIGVLDFLAIKPRTVTLTLEELRESPWSGYASLLPDQTGPFTIEDYVCDELTALLTSTAQQKYIEMKTLYQILDALFDKEFERFTKTQLSSPGSLRPVDVETSFSLSLKQTAWVPVTVIKYSDCVSEQVLMKGNEVYLRLKKIEDLLDNHVPYLNVTSSAKSSFGSFLQLHSSLSTDEILDFLIGWCQRGEDQSKPETFITLMDHVLNIYEYLRRNLSMQRIKELFENYPIIFVPKMSGSGHVPCEGEFSYRQEVCWEDPKGLFTKFRNELRDCHCDIQCPQTLCHIYQGQFQSLFCSPEFGAVRLAPLWKEYVGLLTFVASYYPDSSAVLSDVLSIFEILGRELSVVAEHVAECMGSELRRLIGKDKVFPTKAKSWASIEEKPMLVDKDQLFKWFSGKPGAHFLELEMTEGSKRRKKGKKVAPDYNLDYIQSFLNACRIPTLSSCISTLLTTEMYNLCPDLQEFMWRTMPLLQLYLYNMYSDRYETLQREKVAAKLKIMRFASVGKLEVVYSLKHSNTAVHIQSEACAMDEWSTFYIHKDHIPAVLEIQKEIARVFSDEDQMIRNGIRTFLTDINQMIKERGVPTSEMICQMKDWEALPDMEERWEVEEPKRRLPPVPKVSLKPQEPEVTPAVEEGKENKMKIDGPFLSQWPPPAPSGRKTGDSQTGGGLMSMWPPPKHSDEIPPFARPPTADGPREPGGREPGSGDCQEGAVFTRSQSVQSGGTPGVGGGDMRRPRDDHPPGDQVGEPDLGGGHGLGGGVGPRRGEGDGRPSSDSVLGHGKPEHSGRNLGDYIAEAINQTQDTTSSETAEENLKESESTNVEETSAGSQSPKQTEAEEAGQEMETRRARTTSTGAFATPPRDVRSSHEGTPSRGFVKMGEGIEEEIIFDDLGDLSMSNLPHEIRIEASEDAEEVGRIGEQLVYNFLKKRETFNGLIIVEVVWINRHHETGDPFDILLKLKDDCGNLNEVFIEVKATKTEHKVTMGMSLRELDFASEKQERYYLYRVFNIGEKKKPKLVSINNIKEKLDRKVIHLCMICPAQIALGHGYQVGAVNGDAAFSGNENLSTGGHSNKLETLSFQKLESSMGSQGQGQRLPGRAMLAAIPPQEQKQVLGEHLFPLISGMQPELATKITGMLLELDNAMLLQMLEDRGSLRVKVEEAVSMLEAYQAKYQ